MFFFLDRFFSAKQKNQVNKYEKIYLANVFSTQKGAVIHHYLQFFQTFRKEKSIVAYVPYTLKKAINYACSEVKVRLQRINGVETLI